MSRRTIFSQEIHGGFGKNIGVRVEIGVPGSHIVIGQPDGDNQCVFHPSSIADLITALQGALRALEVELAKARITTSQTMPSAKGQSSSILIISIDSDLKRQVARILSAGGYEIIEMDSANYAFASSGELASSPRLVLYLHSSEMSATSFCTEWKNQRPQDVLIVFINSGEDATVEFAQAVLRAGASEIVICPFSAQVLLFNVSKLLSGMNQG